MREIALAHLDKPRPVLILTRETARPGMTRVTVAPITSTIKGLSSEVAVGQANGLDHEGVASLDNTVTIPVRRLGRTVGFLADAQEHDLARAIVLAFDLDVSVLHRVP
jgi:mRNA interferase MazF